MQFDKKKVLTWATAHKAKKGDIGWVGDNPLYLERAVGCRDQLVKLRMDPITNKNEGAPFQTESVIDYVYFYPAPYDIQQELQGHGFKIGDRVKPMREWEKGEDGFAYEPDERALLDEDDKFRIGEIVEISSDHILVQFDEVRGTDKVPWFVLEGVTEDTHRPFADGDEFRSYKDTLYTYKESTSGDMFTVNRWDSKGAYVGTKYYFWKNFFSRICDADTGEPAGVRL